LRKPWHRVKSFKRVGLGTLTRATGGVAFLKHTNGGVKKEPRAMKWEKSAPQGNSMKGGFLNFSREWKAATPVLVAPSTNPERREKEKQTKGESRAYTLRGIRGQSREQQNKADV